MVQQNPYITNQHEREVIQSHLEKISQNYYDEEYQYETMLSRVNLDERRKQYINTGKGFILGKPQTTTKKDLKAVDGIFSPLYGQTIGDVNAFADRYKCECGHIRMRINEGSICPICKKPVRYVDDDFEYMGWGVLVDDYHIIHPNLYKAVEFYIGKDFQKIIEVQDEKDLDGHRIEKEVKENESPYIGLGMIGFYEKFDEILDYYRKINRSKSNKKEDYYNDIIENRDKIFTQSIPIFTVLLRPVKLDGKTFSYEGANSIYNMMASLIARINVTKLKINRKRKPKNQLLYDLQMKQQELYDYILKVLSGKKGVIRQLFGGRYQFTARDVIISDTSLRIDEVSMSYYALVELLQQTIINILQRIYNFTLDDAYRIWYDANLKPDSRVVKIMEGLINNRDEQGRKGIRVLINRN